MIGSARKRTRYGTRTVHFARCSVPGCPFRGSDHYRRSLAQDDERDHYRREHPRS